MTNDIKYTSNFEELLKSHFFLTPSFSIYGGVRGLFDLGPPGCAIKTNILDTWRKFFILEDNILEIDTTNITPDTVLKVSGHVSKFTDLMVKDLITGICYRADHILEDYMDKLILNPKESDENVQKYKIIKAQADNYSKEELGIILKEFNIKAPDTNNDISDPFPFNLMFKTNIGPTGTSFGYMRPETAQGIFCNFSKLLEYNGGKLPFAGATIGLAFRNEISPRNSLIRVREFQLAEIEHFIFPDETDHPKYNTIKNCKLYLYPIHKQLGCSECLHMTIEEAITQKYIENQTHGYYIARTYLFLVDIGINPNKLRFRQHLPNEKAHYANDCWDAEILTNYGWIECVGLADRGCYDLTKHSQATGQQLGAFRKYKDGPRVETIKTILPNKSIIGKKFNKDSKDIISHLENISNNKIEIERLQVEINNQGFFNIIINDNLDKSFTITKDMIKFTSLEIKTNGEMIIPRVIEPSFGIGRIIYSVLYHAYTERIENPLKKYFAFKSHIAPVKCSILPLLSTQEFKNFIMEITKKLNELSISYKIDDAGKSIGRRYVRTDELGIPFAITIDHTTLSDHTVTIRDRNSMAQVRCPIEKIGIIIKDLSNNKITWNEVWNLPNEFPHVIN